MYTYKDKAFLTGLFGDLALQIITYNYNGDFAGLKEYFKQHGIFESLMIAAGMMYFFGFILELLKISPTFKNLAIYGTILDVAFRVLRLYPSLDNYYEALTPLESIIWAIIPLYIPKYI